MKPNLHLSIIAATLLTACCTSCVSADCQEPDVAEPLAQGRNITTYGDEISFDVSAFTSTSGILPRQFVMSALLKDSDTPSDSYGTLFIDHDMVEDVVTDGHHHWVNNSQTRFWPADKDATLDFYIHASGFEHCGEGKGPAPDTEIEWLDIHDNFSPSLKVFMSDDCDAQDELLYATAFNQRRNADSQAMPLDLELKRAMTQVLFEACLVNENLHVEIYDVKFGGTALGAYFKFPTYASEKASWQIPDHSDNNVSIHMSAMTTDGFGNPRPYVAEKEVKGISYAGSGAAMRPVEGKEMKVISGDYARGRYAAGLWSGTYIKVNCAIWNVAEKNRFNRAADYLMWGTRDAATGEVVPEPIYIPVDWHTDASRMADDMGKCHIYTITFGKGNGAKTFDGLNLTNIADCTLRISDWIE